MLRLLIATALLLTLPPAARAQPTGPGTSAPERARDDAARRSQIVARIGDVALTLGEVEDGLRALPSAQRERYNDRQGFEAYARSLVKFELLGREAERRGFGERAEVARTTRQLLATTLLRREFGTGTTPETVPAEEVEAHYREHAEEFTAPEIRRAHHILVRTEEEARALVAELQGADVHRFERVARAESIDPQTGPRGGDLGYFNDDGFSLDLGEPAGSHAEHEEHEDEHDEHEHAHEERNDTPPPPAVEVDHDDPQGRLFGHGGHGHGAHAHAEDDSFIDPALTEVAFSLSTVGQVHPAPIEVSRGFSVLRLSDIRPAARASLEEVEPDIRLRLFRARREERVNRFVESLRERVSPEVHSERMDPIRLEVRRTGRRTGEGPRRQRRDDRP